MDTTTFWNQVATYNQTTWPIQVLMIIGAAYLTYLVFALPGPKTDVWMRVFLAFTFAWNGIVFFLVFVRNPISMVIGTPLFIIVSAFFVVDIFSQKTEFRLPDMGCKRYFTWFWLILVVLYPLIGWVFLGHAYPKMLLPMFPCPLTVFAVALVGAAAPRTDKKVFIALLPWALLGLPKCFGALDCYEDCILFSSGVYGLIVLIKNWKLIK